MKAFKTLFAASALIALSASAAFAGDQYATWSDQSSAQAGVGSQILNNQVNLQTSWSNLNGSFNTVGGDAAAQGSAAGNMIDITTMNDTQVVNSQIVGPQATIGSNVAVDATNVWGNVSIQNQAVCNGANVSTDPVLTAVRSYQECNASDPYSSIQTNISNVSGNVMIHGMSLGNSLEADSNAANMPIMTRQLNNSATVSNVMANVANVGGNASMSSTAIGNTAQIIHYSTN